CHRLITSFSYSQADFSRLLDGAPSFHQRIEFGIGVAHSGSSTEPATYAIDAMHGEPQHQIYRISSLYEIEYGRRRNWSHKTAGELFSAEGRIRDGGPLGIPSRTEQVIKRRIRPWELGILSPVA